MPTSAETPVPPTTADAFFDYACDACGAPCCERVQLINLALGHEDALRCATCLATAEGLPEVELLRTVRGYIAGRDCFRQPWERFDASACPLVATNACPCQ